MITDIIWDYNGTILDDVDTSVCAVNAMLSARSLAVTTKKEYTDNVSLPLENYYSTVGIKNADMSTLSVEFRQHCEAFSHLSKIFDDFYNAIDTAHKLGIRNILMSSLFSDYLMCETQKYSITGYFDEIIGMGDKKVGSKLDNAKLYISKRGINPQNLLFVGDLTTDAMVASAIGANCVLIPRGHNSKEKLEAVGVSVVENLDAFAKYLQRA